MKWLAVDYGDSRTGLAGCDAGETITSPITPQIEEKSMNKVAAAVTEVLAARGAEGLVCGLPKNMAARYCCPLPHPCRHHRGRQPPLGQAAHAARQRGPQGRL